MVGKVLLLTYSLSISGAQLMTVDIAYLPILKDVSVFRGEWGCDIGLVLLFNGLFGVTRATKFHIVVVVAVLLRK
jgi:hypothetical protein